MKEAIFGAGCFWGVEYKFSQLAGVVETKVGYAAGETENPNYKEVCTDTTGHAEVVWLKYDESQISYEELLFAFFNMHDATQLNRQGPDVGSQYRSIIIATDEDQKEAALNKINEINDQKVDDQKVVTVVNNNCKFFEAEEYHQKYLEKKGISSCKI
ncbi:MAG: peptide-methionine (S)-S-oxide reductase MsrA [Oligoflexia bacterium]|nr:peptide-methionine (S)-S-oxide reductase MsrA [Oligoflexia bacterium]